MSNASTELPDDLERHRPVMRAYALTLTRASGEEDDLVQEAFLRALKVRAEGREIRKPRAYLMTLLHNAFIDLRRTAKTHDADAVDQLEAPGTQDLHQTCREVLEAIGQLPGEQRQLLLLAGVEGLSYAELSREFGVAEGTVNSRLYRARAALRRRLGWEDNVLRATR